MWYIYDYSFIVTNGYRLEPAKKKKRNTETEVWGVPNIKTQCP